MILSNDLRRYTFLFFFSFLDVECSNILDFHEYIHFLFQFERKSFQSFYCSLCIYVFQNLLRYTHYYSYIMLFCNCHFWKPTTILLILSPSYYFLMFSESLISLLNIFLFNIFHLEGILLTSLRYFYLFFSFSYVYLTLFRS